MNRKPIFDFVRTLLGRNVRRSEIEALDRAIDSSLHDTVPSVPSPPANGGPSRAATGGNPSEISDKGIALIKRFEGCARQRSDGMVEAYPDPASGGDPWTIGWGATGKAIERGTIWTQAQCDTRLQSDLKRYAAEVRRAIGIAPTSQAQFDALVSFHYNTGAIAKATLTRMHRSGDFEGTAKEFARWKFAAGRVMKGLERRRAAEAKLYREG